MYVQRVTYLVFGIIVAVIFYRLGLRRGDRRATKTLGHLEYEKMHRAIQGFRKRS